MQRIFQRTQVPSQKVQTNKGLDFTIYEDFANPRPRKGTSIPYSITTKQPREAAPRIPLLKLISILSRST
jgi:hypothetical protein